MEMFINIAHAQTGDSAEGGIFFQVLPLLVLVIIFYFLLIRPQQKRNKEHRAMMAAIAVGDEVATSSGIMGVVLEVQEHTVLLNLGDTKVRFQKQFVQSILPKGTL